MRIAFFMTTVLEHPGGCEKYFIETAASLSDMPGVTADVLTMDEHFTSRVGVGLGILYFRKPNKGAHLREKAADVRRRLGRANYYKLSSLKEMRKRLQEYDVIYSKNELLEGFLIRALLGYKKIPPVIYGGHTPLFYPTASSPQAKLHNFLYGSFMYRFLVGGAAKFHALNDREAERYGCTFSPDRVARIYNPFDITSFRKHAARHAYEIQGYDKNAINILWVGRLTEQKGVRDLELIIPEVNKQAAEMNVPVCWNIFGDGELRAVVESLSSKHANVRYSGLIDQKYMASIYSQHQIFLSTSKWEGYPYTLIEPQAFGLQSFAYDIPGVQDILAAYPGGHLANTPEALVNGLTSHLRQFKRPDLIPKSTASDQFKPEIIYKQLLSLFQKTGAVHANTDS